MPTKSLIRLTDLISHRIARHAPELYEARREEAEQLAGLLSDSIERYILLRKDDIAAEDLFFKIKGASGGQLGGIFENVLDNFVVKQFGLIKEKARPVAEKLDKAHHLLRKIERESRAIAAEWQKAGTIGKKRKLVESIHTTIANQASQISDSIANIRMKAETVYGVSSSMVRRSKEKLGLS